MRELSVICDFLKFVVSKLKLVVFIYIISYMIYPSYCIDQCYMYDI